MRNKPGKKGRGKSDPIKQRKTFPNIVTKVIDESDIILEILDARFIKDTRNIKIEDYIKKQKKILIYVLNKSDLVEVKDLKKELETEQIHPFEIISSKTRKGSRELRDRIKRESKKIGNQKIYVGIIGYPNTGKSSVINILVGKHSARTASQSGFTKGIQKLKLSENVYLLDSPGVIPISEYSSIKSEALGKHTKISVRTYDKVKDPEMQVAYLMKAAPSKIEKFYQIKANGNSEILIEELGRKKHIIKKGDEVDGDKVARLILKDWQEGRIY